jgi:hypothetical protein
MALVSFDAIDVVYALLRGGGVSDLRKSCDPARRQGLGADVEVTASTKRAGLALIAEAAGAAALVAAFTASVSAQSGPDFLNNTDPLFAGVLAHPGNLDNTIQYAASAAAQGDIESAELP